MAYFYGNPTTQQVYGFIPYDEQEASRHYCKHYLNYLLLHHMSRHLKNYNDRQQCFKELAHCERVMNRWKLHPNWDETEVFPILERLKKLSFRQLAKMAIAVDEEDE
jgi:hypothetical protein